MSKENGCSEVCGATADGPAATSPQRRLGLNLAERAAKRLFDLVVVVAFVALFWWLLLLVMLAVRISSGSPLIFGHTRMGRDGKEFTCYKFRSMVPNAEEVLENLLATNPAASEEWLRDFKLKDDPRITAVGRFIRKTSLDELPQLWNVLVNDMSVVGPRPVVRTELSKYYGDSIGHYQSVKPGLTGPWQVGGRNDIDYEGRVAMDRQYVENWSMLSDIVIVLRTAGVIFSRKGAY